MVTRIWHIRKNFTKCQEVGKLARSWQEIGENLANLKRFDNLSRIQQVAKDLDKNLSICQEFGKLVKIQYGNKGL